MAAKKTSTKAAPEPKKSRSGPSGPSQTDEQRADRGLGRLTLRMSQKALDKLTREATRRDVSRAALLEELIEKL